MLGLPDQITTCLFDLDGVLTQTAKVHAAAWKATFDAFLRERDGDGYRPFDQVADYDEYVDGKPREDGVRDFLASRGITLPDGSPDDPPTTQSVYGVGNRKNEDLQRRIERDGVEVYDGSVRYLAAARAAGLRCVVVSSSANTEQVLKVTGMQQYVEGRVDGLTLQREHLKGKPAPDSFLAGAKLVDTPPQQAVVFEDALAGVAAGRAGGFGFVVGVDRVGQAAALKEHGADVVVSDLGDLLEVPR
ncbi:haloacid dehalogenase superfamily, subfamily IA, variant 3 with third motif having DD or ED/beta-phosphoglucomutase family hydrolase [Frankineae bacterium MT45]|nr:haloacid dehalogenase superfamily, subfamily IA, variant 3 with third motif having DD or ED/beta-phosphoglucomutase family hydrolase [Frankineae bacterium MT45]